MKKLSIWFILTLTLVIGFTSCEVNEEFDNDPEVEIIVDNKEGSAVYSFEAKTSGMEDAQLIWTVDGEVIDGENQNEIINQILDYLFESGTHTICVKLIKGDVVREACVDIDVTVDENDPCPDLFFKAKKYEGPLTYKFMADFRGIDSLSYGWFINGELVEDSAPDEDNYLLWDFEGPGRYEVCIKAETPDCPEGTSYCKVIEIEERDVKCPDVKFEVYKKDVVIVDNDSIHKYKFAADFESLDRVSRFKWFVDEVQIEDPNTQQNGGAYFFYEFTEGVYIVCLKVEVEGCDEELSYCEEIFVRNMPDAKCPELFFEKERDGDKAAYYFYPRAFDGIDDTQLDWFVNGDFVGSSPEFPHNNPFYHEFDGPGRYEVCLMIETPECPEGTSFCKVIEIESSVACPELFFEAEQDGDNLAYYFYPREFEGMADVTLEWFVDGELVDSVMGSADPFYYQFNPGTYEICLMIETPECPNGTQICKAIEIPEPPQ